MSRVVADMSMSLDGFIAGPNEDVSLLFGWMGGGDVVTATANEHVTFRTSAASAQRIRDALDQVGALVVGRHLFDMTHGWGGAHPMGVPVFVVTHEAPDDWAFPDAPFTFVTDGVRSAVEQASTAAGGKDVGVASAKIAQQCLDAGLLDELQISSVPSSSAPVFDRSTTSTRRRSCSTGPRSSRARV